MAALVFLCVFQFCDYIDTSCGNVSYFAENLCADWQENIHPRTEFDKAQLVPCFRIIAHF